MSKHDDYVRWFRELARELHDLRQAKQVDLSKPSALDAAEAILSHPECNTAWMDKEANILFTEVLRLRSLPDVNGYDGFQAPSLDDDPFDFT